LLIPIDKNVILNEYQMPEIIIIDTKNPQETKTIKITPEEQINQECLIGRDNRCYIVLKDNLTSRTHGKITFRHGSYFYSDLGSRNGSKINNENVQVNQEYSLKPSDTIALGSHLLWVKAIAEEKTALAPQSLAPEQYMPLAKMDTASLETWTQGIKQLKCVQIIDETVDVKTFTFVCEPPVKFDYQPGQSLTLNLDIDGKSVKHPYSISSTPSRPHTLEITVKRVSTPEQQHSNSLGLVNNWLHDNLQVGTQITADAPMGNFTNFAHPAAKLLLISASSGITPMMSMSRWICDTVSNVDIVFLHSARTPQDLIFRQELEMMSSRYPNFKLALTVTRSVLGQPWYGYRGRINETSLQAIAPDYQKRIVYVSGPNPFIEATKKLLQKINFPLEQYYEESFGGTKQSKVISTMPDVLPTSIIQTPAALAPAAAPAHISAVSTPALALAPAAAPAPTNISAVPATRIVNNFAPIPVPVSAPAHPVIVLSKSGQEVSYKSQECILDVAEAEGAALPSGCRMGVCGACKVKKIAGEVVYDEDVACEHGFIYTCVARPVGRVVLEA
jgi:glycine betaine catabolism B